MNDDELLDQLADALTPAPCVPPAEGLQALHRSVDAATHGASSHRRRLRRRWLLPALATVAALGVCNLALAAAGTSLPRVVRAAAHDVNLPVDSPALVDTRQHRDALRAALDRADPRSIESEARQLRAAFARLDNGERNKMAVEVDQLLTRAESKLAAVNDHARSTTLTPSATPTITQDPTRQPATHGSDTTRDGKGPDTSTGDETIDPSSTHGSTGSDGGQDNGTNHSGGSGLNLDTTQPDLGQVNSSTNQDGAGNAIPSGGNGSG